MTNVNVRGLSAETKEALRVRAAKAGMSLEAFARRALQKASVEAEEEPIPMLSLIEQYFGADHGVELDLPARGSKRDNVDFT